MNENTIEKGTEKNVIPGESAATIPEQEKMYPLEYVQEAQLLLAYATQQGLEIDESIVSVIVNSRYQLEHGEWNSEHEIAFWMAFDTITKLVHPVSIASLKATRTYGKRQTKKGKITSQISAAERTVTIYQRWTLLVLAVLLIAQIYWLIGSVIITAVTKEIPTQLKDLDEKINTVTETINRARQEDNEADARLAIAERDKYENERKNLEDSKNAYYGSLRKWSKVLCLGIFCSDESEEEYNRKGYIKARQAARIVLQPIQLYILPLLYGLLGASAYVLRSITREIRDLTYTTDSNARYRLRIQLGSLAGLAVGWFLFIPPDSTGSGSLFSFKELSPLALSFLAGYSVELLFAAMDKLVAAFLTESPPKRTSS